MKYDVVQQSLEEFVKDSWAELTPMQFDNVGFSADMVDRYVRLNIVFGEAQATTVTKGCYRQFGLMIFTIFVKPSTGSNEKLQLAHTAAEKFTSQIVRPVSPLVAPTVNLKVPDLHSEDAEQNGWVFAQLSFPFFYDHNGV